MMKRMISLLLTAIIVLSVLSGCSAGKPGEAVPAAGAGEEPAAISIFMIFNKRAFEDDWGVFIKAGQVTDTSIKSYTSRNETDEVQAYNLMLSTGELADIVCYTVVGLEKLGADGGMMDLTQLIEEHGPNITAFFEANPDLKKDLYSVDGNIYALPSFVDYKNLKATEGLFLRTDWVKQLGYEVPETLDELEAVLTAFIEEDANGNGMKDEVPYFRRSDLETAISNLLHLFGSHSYRTSGGHSGFYVDEGGRMQYAPLGSDYRFAVEKAADWYAKGLIDKEIFTRGMGARDALLPTNLGGSTVDWFPSTSNYNNLNGDIEGFELMPVAPVTIEGDRTSLMMARSTNNGRGWGISANCKNPEAAIRILDYFFSEEGIRAFNYGVEGETYVMEDGKPVFTDKVLNSPDGQPPLEVLNSIGAQQQDMGSQQLAEYEYMVSGDIAKLGFDIYMQGDNTKDSMPILKYTNAEVQELERIMAEVMPYVEESFQKWVLGAASVEDDYDTFIKTLESLDIERAIEIQQTAYDRYME